MYNGFTLFVMEMRCMETTAACGCSICRELPADVVAYLDRDEELPAEVKRLTVLGTWFRRCPECGALYSYNYMPPGAGNIGDREDLHRLTDRESRFLRPLLDAAGPVRLASALVSAITELGWGDDSLVPTAVEHLAERGVPKDQLVKSLSRLLRNESVAVRRFAAHRLKVLAYMRTDVSGALTGLIRCMKSDEDGNVVWNAAGALANQAKIPTARRPVPPKLLEFACQRSKW